MVTFCKDSYRIDWSVVADNCGEIASTIPPNSILTLRITTAHALTCHSLGFGDVCFGHKIGQVILAKQRHLYQS